MSFLTDLNTGCSAYTAFTYNGSSIKLPYYLGGKRRPTRLERQLPTGAVPQKQPPRFRHTLATIAPLLALLDALSLCMTIQLAVIMSLSSIL